MTAGAAAALPAALVAALGELHDVDKSRTADAGTYKYRYAALADVFAGARPVLARHGLAITQRITTDVDGATVSVATVILHTSGETFEAGRITFPLGATAQATGSTISYARRYAVMAALGIAGADDDDDAQAATAATPPAGRARMGAKAQIDRLANAFESAEIPRGDRPGITAAVIGRTPLNSHDLTADEIAAIVAAVDAIAAGTARPELTDAGDWRIIPADTPTATNGA